MDTIDGTVKEVLRRGSSKPFAPSGHAIALQKEKSIVLATNETLLLIESGKRWAQAAVLQNEMKMKEGETVVVVATREGETAYILVKSHKGYRIEEAVWTIQGYIWGIIFLGCLVISLLNLLWWISF